MPKLGVLLDLEGSRSLYKELEEEIFSRLPVKSLARCRCVCKSWRDLISSERFISLHYKNYNSSYLLVGNCNTFEEGPLLSFLPLSPAVVSDDTSGSTLQKVDGFKLPRALRISRYVLMTGVCNGIVCLHTGLADKIVLWNPATKEFKILPESKITRPNDKPFRCAVGFGYDLKRNDYKVLQMVYNAFHPVAQLELFSLRTNSWKKVDSNEFIVECGAAHDKVCNLPCTENRVICVLGTRKRHSSRLEVMFFDVCSETFDIISVMDAPSSNCHINLFPFKKSIALGVKHGRGCCDIWVFDDLYPTQSKSWSKLLSIEPDLMRGVRPIIGIWDSLILVQDISSDGQVGLFECSKHIVLDVTFPCCRLDVAACFYKESLVGIREIEEGDLEI